VARTCSGCDRAGLRVERYLCQQLTRRRLAHRPRVAGIGRPLGAAARDVIPFGYTQIGERGTIIDAAIRTQCAQIPLPGIDLDRIYVRLLLIAALCIVA
jgi:hypothetical protein